MASLLAIIISIGSAWTAYQIGISPSIGAFIAGMLLGSSSFATQITADIAPLRILFLTLFFGSAGMLADPVWVFNNFALVILLSVAVILSKTLISFVIFSLSGHSIAISVASALSIAQIGVVGGLPHSTDYSFFELMPKKVPNENIYMVLS